MCLVAMWLAAACAGLNDAPAASNAVPTVGSTPATDATPEPTPPEDTPSVAPEATPTETPLESPSASPSIAASCTGTDANREFFATVATKVPWDVYCAVLPRGWSVDTGSYRTSNGGWLKIAYKASGGRRFELREGAFCTDPATCLPTGVEIAPGPFGDREATVLQVEDGGFAMIVDQGQRIMWAAIGKGMDETTFRNYAEALTLVADY
jgi:hypothetical protein